MSVPQYSLSDHEQIVKNQRDKILAYKIETLACVRSARAMLMENLQPDGFERTEDLQVQCTSGPCGEPMQDKNESKVQDSDLKFPLSSVNPTDEICQESFQNSFEIAPEETVDLSSSTVAVRAGNHRCNDSDLAVNSAESELLSNSLDYLNGRTHEMPISLPESSFLAASQTTSNNSSLVKDDLVGCKDLNGSEFNSNEQSLSLILGNELQIRVSTTSPGHSHIPHMVDSPSECAGTNHSVRDFQSHVASDSPAVLIGNHTISDKAKSMNIPQLEDMLIEGERESQDQDAGLMDRNVIMHSKNFSLESATPSKAGVKRLHQSDSANATATDLSQPYNAAEDAGEVDTVISNSSVASKAKTGTTKGRNRASSSTNAASPAAATTKLTKAEKAERERAEKAERERAEKQEKSNKAGTKSSRAAQAAAKAAGKQQLALQQQQQALEQQQKALQQQQQVEQQEKLQQQLLLQQQIQLAEEKAAKEDPVTVAACRRDAVFVKLAECERESLRSRRVPPLVLARTRSHWDHVLEEVQFMAIDFKQELRLKLVQNRAIAAMCAEAAVELQGWGAAPVAPPTIPVATDSVAEMAVDAASDEESVAESCEAGVSTEEAGGRASESVQSCEEEAGLRAIASAIAKVVRVHWKEFSGSDYEILEATCSASGSSPPHVIAICSGDRPKDEAAEAMAAAAREVLESVGPSAVLADDSPPLDPASAPFLSLLRPGQVAAVERLLFINRRGLGAAICGQASTGKTTSVAAAACKWLEGDSSSRQTTLGSSSRTGGIHGESNSCVLVLCARKNVLRWATLFQGLDSDLGVEVFDPRNHGVRTREKSSSTSSSYVPVASVDPLTKQSSREKAGGEISHNGLKTLDGRISRSRNVYFVGAEDFGSFLQATKPLGLRTLSGQGVFGSVFSLDTDSEQPPRRWRGVVVDNRGVDLQSVSGSLQEYALEKLTPAPKKWATLVKVGDSGRGEGDIQQEEKEDKTHWISLLSEYVDHRITNRCVVTDNEFGEADQAALLSFLVPQAECLYQNWQEWQHANKGSEVVNLLTISTNSEEDGGGDDGRTSDVVEEIVSVEMDPFQEWKYSAILEQLVAADAFSGQNPSLLSKGLMLLKRACFHERLVCITDSKWPDGFITVLSPPPSPPAVATTDQPEAVGAATAMDAAGEENCSTEVEPSRSAAESKEGEDNVMNNGIEEQDQGNEGTVGVDNESPQGNENGIDSSASPQQPMPGVAVDSVVDVNSEAVDSMDEVMAVVATADNPEYTPQKERDTEVLASAMSVSPDNTSTKAHDIGAADQRLLEGTDSVSASTPAASAVVAFVSNISRPNLPLRPPSVFKSVLANSSITPKRISRGSTAASSQKFSANSASFKSDEMTGCCKLQALLHLLQKLAGQKIAIMVNGCEEQALVQSLLREAAIPHLSCCLTGAAASARSDDVTRYSRPFAPALVPANSAAMGSEDLAWLAGQQALYQSDRAGDNCGVHIRIIDWSIASMHKYVPTGIDVIIALSDSWVHVTRPVLALCQQAGKNKSSAADSATARVRLIRLVAKGTLEELIISRGGVAHIQGHRIVDLQFLTPQAIAYVAMTSGSDNKHLMLNRLPLLCKLRRGAGLMMDYSLCGEEEAADWLHTASVSGETDVAVGASVVGPNGFVCTDLNMQTVLLRPNPPPALDSADGKKWLESLGKRVLAAEAAFAAGDGLPFALMKPPAPKRKSQSHRSSSYRTKAALAVVGLVRAAVAAAAHEKSLAHSGSALTIFGSSSGGAGSYSSSGVGGSYSSSGVVGSFSSSSVGGSYSSSGGGVGGGVGSVDIATGKDMLDSVCDASPGEATTSPVDVEQGASSPSVSDSAVADRAVAGSSSGRRGGGGGGGAREEAAYMRSWLTGSDELDWSFASNYRFNTDFDLAVDNDVACGLVVGPSIRKLFDFSASRSAATVLQRLLKRGEVQQAGKVLATGGAQRGVGSDVGAGGIFDVGAGGIFRKVGRANLEARMASILACSRYYAVLDDERGMRMGGSQKSKTASRAASMPSNRINFSSTGCGPVEGDASLTLPDGQGRFKRAGLGLSPSEEEFWSVYESWEGGDSETAVGRVSCAQIFREVIQEMRRIGVPHDPQLFIHPLQVTAENDVLEAPAWQRSGREMEMEFHLKYLIKPAVSKVAKKQQRPFLKAEAARKRILEPSVNPMDLKRTRLTVAAPGAHTRAGEYPFTVKSVTSPLAVRMASRVPKEANMEQDPWTTREDAMLICIQKLFDDKAFILTEFALNCVSGAGAATNNTRSARQARERFVSLTAADKAKLEINLETVRMSQMLFVLRDALKATEKLPVVGTQEVGAAEQNHGLVWTKAASEATEQIVSERKEKASRAAAELKSARLMAHTDHMDMDLDQDADMDIDNFFDQPLSPLRGSNSNLGMSSLVGSDGDSPRNTRHVVTQSVTFPSSLSSPFVPGTTAVAIPPMSADGVRVSKLLKEEDKQRHDGLHQFIKAMSQASERRVRPTLPGVPTPSDPTGGVPPTQAHQSHQHTVVSSQVVSTFNLVQVAERFHVVKAASSSLPYAATQQSQHVQAPVQQGNLMPSLAGMSGLGQLSGMTQPQKQLHAASAGPFQPQGQSQGQSQGQLQGQLQGQSQGQSQSQLQAQSQAQSQSQLQAQSQAQAQSQSQLQAQSQVQSQGQSHQGLAQGQSQVQSQGHSQSQGNQGLGQQIVQVGGIQAASLVPAVGMVANGVMMGPGGYGAAPLSNGQNITVGGMLPSGTMGLNAAGGQSAAGPPGALGPSRSMPVNSSGASSSTPMGFQGAPVAIHYAQSDGSLSNLASSIPAGPGPSSAPTHPQQSQPQQRFEVSQHRSAPAVLPRNSSQWVSGSAGANGNSVGANATASSQGPQASFGIMSGNIENNSSTSVANSNTMGHVNMSVSGNMTSASSSGGLAGLLHAQGGVSTGALLNQRVLAPSGIHQQSVQQTAHLHAQQQQQQKQLMQQQMQYHQPVAQQQQHVQPTSSLQQQQQLHHLHQQQQQQQQYQLQIQYQQQQHQMGFNQQQQQQQQQLPYAYAAGTSLSVGSAGGSSTVPPTINVSAPAATGAVAAASPGTGSSAGGAITGLQGLHIEGMAGSTMGSGTAGAGSGGGVTSGVPLSGSGLHVGAGDVSTGSLQGLARGSNNLSAMDLSGMSLGVGVSMSASGDAGGSNLPMVSQAAAGAAGTGNGGGIVGHSSGPGVPASITAPSSSTPTSGTSSDSIQEMQRLLARRPDLRQQMKEILESRSLTDAQKKQRMRNLVRQLKEECKSDDAPAPATAGPPQSAAVTQPQQHQPQVVPLQPQHSHLLSSVGIASMGGGSLGVNEQPPVLSVGPLVQVAVPPALLVPTVAPSIVSTDAGTEASAGGGGNESERNTAAAQSTSSGTGPAQPTTQPTSSGTGPAQP